MLKRFTTKKHWKPPFGGIIILLWIFVVLWSPVLTSAQQVQASDDVQYDFEVIIQPKPYSFEFSLNDTENYAIENVTCRLFRNLDSPGEGVSCEDLLPCTNYSIKVFVQHIPMVEEVIQIDLNSSTLYTEPIVNIVSIEPSIQSILITWDAKDDTCISKFIIGVTNSQNYSSYEGRNDVRSWVAPGLQPCTLYGVTLNTYNIEENLVSNLTENTETLYQDPGSVSVNFENKENGNTRVWWEPPSYKSCINYYLLKLILLDCVPNDEIKFRTTDDSFIEGSGDPIEKPENDSSDADLQKQCEWDFNVTDSELKEYILDDLDGCDEYKFDIFINNNEVSNCLNCQEEKFLSAEHVPGAVSTNSSDWIIEPTQITLNWSPPTAHKKCLKEYIVKIMGPIQKEDPLVQIQNNIKENTVAFSKLEPCGTYDFIIIPISLSDTEGQELKSSFETAETVPTKVRNCNVSPEPYSFLVTWDEPDFGDLCISGYLVSTWRTDMISLNFNVTETKINIENLYPCQAYTIQIIAYTKTNNNGPEVQIENETSAIEAKAPNNFQHTAIYHNQFELSAQDSDLQNTCETIVGLFECNVTQETGGLNQNAEQFVEGQVGGISFKALLYPLTPYTEYKCFVSLFNVAGWSPKRMIILKTTSYFPEMPKEVKLNASTNVSLNYVWKEPTFANGNIKLYISNFQTVEPDYYVPPECSVSPITYVTRETSSLELTLYNLEPSMKYSIQVATQNDYGVGEYSSPYIISTKPWISEGIRDLVLIPVGPCKSDEEYNAYVSVSFRFPCKSNGDIESFRLEFHGEHYNLPIDKFGKTVSPDHDGNGVVTHNESKLKPDYVYNVSVMVRTKAVEYLSLPVMQQFEAPAGFPKRLNSSTLESIRVNPFEARNPAKSAAVFLPSTVLDSDVGEIFYAALLLSEKGCNPEPRLDYGALNSHNDWTDSKNWYQATKGDCISQYQTTDVHWKPELNEAGTFAEYIMGETKCDDNNNQEYCNGPLKPDTKYHMVLRLFTKSGYNDAAILEFQTDSLIRYTTIIVSVCSCFVLALIAGFTYMWITKRISWKRKSYNGIADFFGDIIPKNFAIYYQDLSKPDKLAREFKELTMVAMDLSYSASELGCNKNRYADIFPYDKNRVILDIDAEGSDYINASFIDGYRCKKEYIATQGPKPESTMDFWRMILQHNVRIIVMVTQFREGDMIKCHEYFPFQSKSINVTIRKKDTSEIYDRTEMIISHPLYGLKQKVIHFFFKKWPDHGCPTDPMHLITFVRKVKAERIPSYSPIVVHCSAGVGRTGTFIGLDIIMQRIKNESKINIYEAVKKLRFQRMKMVQTVTQYMFLYTCTFELVKHKVKRNALQNENQENREFTVDTNSDTTSNKLHSRRNFDLSTIDENKILERNGKNTEEPSTSNGVSFKFISLPDREIEDHTPKRTHRFMEDNTESFM